MNIEIHPLTPDRWDDLVTLFGPKGAQEGCWCMWWRQTAKEWKENKGGNNRRAMEVKVMAGEEPGLIAYADGEPVGWVSLGPRESFVRLKSSRILKPVDDREVWSIICFFVARDHRRSGLSVRLLRAAADHARDHGATVLEGYPTEPKDGKAIDIFVYTGLMSAFDQVGFVEVERRSEKRPIMRLELDT
jgi:GNAT superfamily N-acetyltransferase